MRVKCSTLMVNFYEASCCVWSVVLLSVEMWSELLVKTLNLHPNAHAVLDRPTRKDVNERIFRSGLFQGPCSTDSTNSTDSMNNIDNEFKPDLTSSNHIVDDQNSTNDNTNDDDKTNYTEMNLSRHEESRKVANTGIYEESKQEKNKKHPSAILENNVFNLQFFGLKADKISKLFLVCALFIISLLCLLNIGEFSILCNDELISFLSLYYIVFSLSVVIVILLTYMYFILRQSIENIVISLENDCNLFEKSVLLSSDLYYDNKSYLSKQSPRSRYANYCITFERTIHKPRYVARRDREPSRIPTKQLTRVMNKNRNIRKFVRQYIARNVPASSRIHCFIAKCGFNHSIHCKYKGMRKKRYRIEKNQEKNKIRNVVSDSMYQSSNMRRGGLAVRALDFGSSGPGSIPRPGDHVVSLGKILYSLSASSFRIRT